MKMGGYLKTVTLYCSGVLAIRCIFRHQKIKFGNKKVEVWCSLAKSLSLRLFCVSSSLTFIILPGNNT